MSVKLRLTRVGKKKNPMYRVVVADERSSRDGRFIEIIGQYQPLENPSGITIKDDRALYWLSQGAQPTETVYKILTVSGVWEQYEKTRPKGAKPFRVSTPKKAAPKVSAKHAAKAEAEEAKAQEAESAKAEEERAEVVEEATAEAEAVAETPETTESTESE